MLDTHTAFWVVARPDRLTSTIRNLISDPANEIWVSVVSLWEIAIKNGLARRGSGHMPITAAAANSYFNQAGIRSLGVTVEHALALERLPPLHGDPFDRLLLAQALCEPLRFVTHDAKLTSYSDTVILF